MNIKSVVNNITPADSNQKAEKSDSVKTEASHKDKEGDGRQEPGDQGSEQRQMTDAELAKALNLLRDLKGVKDNNLKVELFEDGSRRVILIKDVADNIVRRLPEKDLWSLFQDDPDKPTGHILKKAV